MRTGLVDESGTEFDNKIDDESTYPTPAVEIGARVLSRHHHPGFWDNTQGDLAVDRGSGSMAEYSALWSGGDGRLEVMEDDVKFDGETAMGWEDIIEHPPVHSLMEDGAETLGDMSSLYGRYGRDWAGNMHVARSDRPTGVIGDPTVAASDHQTTVIGDPTVAASDRQTTVVGDAMEFGRYGHIGEANGRDQMGSYAMYGPTEVGNMHVARSDRQTGVVGDAMEFGRYGYIGAEDVPAAGLAVVRVIETARDNRQPAPPMKALDADAPETPDEDWSLTDVVFGAAVAAQAAGAPTDQFPLLTKCLQRAGAGMEPRFVRVDTEESYKQFRAQNSPEMQNLAERVDDIDQRVREHASDPSAHEAADIDDDIADLVHLGQEVQAAEQDKRVDLWMPQRFDGKVEAWREGEFVCASIALPGSDGEIRICTSLEPIRKCVTEMTKHASESGVPAETVVGVLPAMGCVLGAGTAVKEMAAGAQSILQRPEAAGKQPFVVRLEPKVSPNFAALAMLADACRNGDVQACDEWKRLASASAPQVQMAMQEVMSLLQGTQSA